MSLPFINMRFIGLTLGALVLAGGAGGGWWWWRNRPESLYSAAMSYYQEGQEANKGDDKTRARTAYERADSKLHTLVLKEPANYNAWLLRAKVNAPLARIVRAEDVSKAAGITGLSFGYAQNAALGDRKLFEAQAFMIEHYFSQDTADPSSRTDNLDRAEPYAQALIENLPQTRPDMENWENYVAGAYYVLARAALRVEPLDKKRPDMALNHARESLKWEQEVVKKDPRAAAGVPRWRTLNMEARALKIKSEQAAQARQGRTVGGKPAKDEALEQLEAKIPGWMDRARRELEEMVPASGNRPAQTAIVALSKTNAIGLLDLLLLAAHVGPTPQAVMERSELLMEVCEKMIQAKEVSDHIPRSAARYASLLPNAIAFLPPGRVPDAKYVDSLNTRVMKLGDSALTVTVDPATYLQMSRNNRKEGKLARAMELAIKGLEVAERQKTPNLNPALFGLHGEAAWLYLIQRKSTEAQKHLNELSRMKMSSHVTYMQGLAAVLEGKLEEGSTKLETLYGKAPYTDDVPLLLGLSHAYMGQGRHDRALPVLEKVWNLYNKPGNTDPEVDLIRKYFLPDLTAVALDLFRCHLSLSGRPEIERGRREKHMAQAMEFRKSLRDTASGPSAESLLVNTMLTQAKVLEATQPDQAQALIERASDAFESTPAAIRDDPRLVWTKVNLLLARNQVNTPVVASAAFSSLGATSDMTMQVVAQSRRLQGMSWQWQEAEDVVRGLRSQKDNLQAQFGWAKWLQARGRAREAVTYLDELAKQATTESDRRRILMYRSSMAVLSGQNDAVTMKMVEDLGQGNPDFPAEVLALLAGFEGGTSPRNLEEQLKTLLTRHQQNGLLHYWHALTRKGNGDFLEAIASFERSLEFQEFRTPSQNGLLECIAGLVVSPKSGPEGAHKEATRLVNAHPNDHMVLLAHAYTCRLLDDLTTMRASLERLPKALEISGRTPNAAAMIAASLAARQWLDANRPDVARQEVEKILKIEPKHLPSLVIARDLAAADDDWPVAIRYMNAIREIQPEYPDLMMWQAGLHLIKGEMDEAKKIWTDYVAKFPERPIGYLRLANVHERANDLPSALDWVRRWRKKYPDDVSGLTVELRVLARAGKTAEATQKGEEFVQSQVARGKRDLEQAEEKSPAKDDKQKAARAQFSEQSLAAVEMTAILLVAGGLQDANQFALSEQWVRRAQKLIDKLPEAARKSQRITLQRLVGGLYLSQGREEKDKQKRMALIDQAIKEYESIWSQAKGDVIAGNNLAWLLCTEKDNPTAALTIIEEVRKGRISQKPISGDRLQLELLDTVGVIYQAAGRSEDAIKLFEEALQRYRTEPRVLLHMGRSLRGGGKIQDQKAYQSLNLAIQHAETKVKMANDPDRKAKLEEVIKEARAEQKKIGLLAPKQ